MTRPRTVLVTGAGGFLGGAIARHLESIGDEVLRWSAPTHARLPDPSFADEVRRRRPDAIVHAAGTASVAQSFADSERSFRDDAALTRWICEAIAQASPETALVFLSSAAVYGEPRELPITERTPAAPVSPYGFHKVMAEEACREHVRCFDGRAAVLRIFSAYGPGLRRQLLWDIARRWRAESGELVLAGTGEETRDFILADDVAVLVGRVLSRAELLDGAPLNVGTGRAVSVAEVARLMLDALGGDRRLRFSHEARRGDPQRWAVDAQRAQALAGAPFVGIEDGVRRYVDWLRSEGLA